MSCCPALPALHGWQVAGKLAIHPPPPAPPQFLAVLMRPNPKHTGRLRKLLAQQFAHGVGSEHFSAEGDDMFPYVSFTLNIEG